MHSVRCRHQRMDGPYGKIRVINSSGYRQSRREKTNKIRRLLAHFHVVQLVELSNKNMQTVDLTLTLLI